MGQSVVGTSRVLTALPTPRGNGNAAPQECAARSCQSGPCNPLNFPSFLLTFPAPPPQHSHAQLTPQAGAVDRGDSPCPGRGEEQAWLAGLHKARGTPAAWVLLRGVRAESTWVRGRSCREAVRGASSAGTAAEGVHSPPAVPRRASPRSRAWRSAPGGWQAAVVYQPKRAGEGWQPWAAMEIGKRLVRGSHGRGPLDWGAGGEGECLRLCRALPLRMEPNSTSEEATFCHLRSRPAVRFCFAWIVSSLRPGTCPLEPPCVT